jgi:hypothetical protein
MTSEAPARLDDAGAESPPRLASQPWKIRTRHLPAGSFPVGRYRGQSLEWVRQRNPEYLAWRLHQPWFRKHFGGLCAEIERLFARASQPPPAEPEPSSLAVQLKDPLFCAGLAGYVFAAALSGIRIGASRGRPWECMAHFGLERWAAMVTCNLRHAPGHWPRRLLVEAISRLDGVDAPAFLRELSARADPAGWEDIATTRVLLIEHSPRHGLRHLAASAGIQLVTLQDIAIQTSISALSDPTLPTWGG